jgi:glyoxylase-like metal-dependent hydrolase (beta-lactamase superfamily II)
VTRAVRVLASNPGPYTLEGTNTWVVGEEPALVIDPGPPGDSHLEEVIRTARRVAAIALTHHHPDHAPAAQALAALTEAPVLAMNPVAGEEQLSPGDALRANGADLEVVPTPGHSPDHCAFFDRSSGALFTGDAVLGRGTSVVDPPEGDMAQYVASLHRMLDLAPAVIYPGHGPAAWSAQEKLREYLEHRALREQQILHALRGGPRSAEELVPSIYGGYPEALRGPAARSVFAHLVKLEREGRVSTMEGGGDAVCFELSAGPEGSTAKR